ncbi:hypothetical protein AAMO2058_000479400 [Amorphochlora amoebiformis]
MYTYIYTHIIELMGPPKFLSLIEGLKKRVNTFDVCRGNRVGIDTSVWLHQIVHSKELVDLAKEKGVQTARECVCFWIMHRTYKLLKQNIYPFHVFDGLSSPHKKHAHAKRAASKAHFACPLDFKLIKLIISHLRQAGLMYIVSPYESDHQLAMLDRLGVIEYVITEDVDLILHGCRNVMLKVEFKSGQCDLYQNETFGNGHGNGNSNGNGRQSNGNGRQSNDNGNNGLTVTSSVTDLVSRWGFDIVKLIACCYECDYGKIQGLGAVTAVKMLSQIEGKFIEEKGGPQPGPERIAQQIKKTIKRCKMDEKSIAEIIWWNWLGYTHQLAYNPNTYALQQLHTTPLRRLSQPPPSLDISSISLPFSTSHLRAPNGDMHENFGDVRRTVLVCVRDKQRGVSSERDVDRVYAHVSGFRRLGRDTKLHKEHSPPSLPLIPNDLSAPRNLWEFSESKIDSGKFWEFFQEISSGGGDRVHVPINERLRVREKDINEEIRVLMKRFKWRLVALYCYSFGCLGIALASLGPALPHIAKKTNSSLRQAGTIFTARSAGYASGSVIGGIATSNNKTKDHGNLLICTCMVAVAIGTICAPFFNQIWILGGFICLQGVAMGVLDTAGNLLILHLITSINLNTPQQDTKSQSEPYLQSLHFVFALGAVAAPVIVGVFLGAQRFPINPLIPPFGIIGGLCIPAAIFAYILPSPPSPSKNDFEREERKKTEKLNFGGGNSQNPTVDMEMHPLFLSEPKSNLSESRRRNSERKLRFPEVKDGFSEAKEGFSESKEGFSKAKEGFSEAKEGFSEAKEGFSEAKEGSSEPRIGSSEAGIGSEDYLDEELLRNSEEEEYANNLVPTEPKDPSEPMLSEPTTRAEAMGSRNGRKKRIIILGGTAMFLFAYVGVEVTTGGYLYTYTLKSGLGGHSTATAVNTCFWVMLAAGRGAAIFLSSRLTPSSLLALNCGVGFVSVLIPMCFSRSLVALFLGMSLYGVALASSFPTAFTLADSYIGVDSVGATIFVAGASIGEMIIPLLTAHLIQFYGVWSLFIILTAGNAIMLGILGIMVLVGEGMIPCLDASNTEYAEVSSAHVDVHVDRDRVR